MAQYTAYANYIIYFADPSDYAAAIAACGGNGYGHCPLTAATQFGITWPLATGPLGTKGIYGFAPYGIPASPGPGIEIKHPEPSGVYLKSDIDSVLVPGQVGNPLTPPGPDMLLKWWGMIIKINSQAGGGTLPPETPIPQRRFVGGLETSHDFAEGGSAFNADVGNRHSSRTMDGRGMPIRGTNTGGANWLRQQNEFDAALLPKTTWERFYVRINTLGTNICGIWKGSAKTNTLVNASIRVDTSGFLLLYTTTAGGVETLQATSSFALSVGVWYLIDVIIRFPVNAADYGGCRIWVNHTLDITFQDTSGTGLDTIDTHGNSRLGQHTTGEAEWSIDLDDWIGADVPNRSGAEFLDSIDWILGSHVRAVSFDSGVLTNYAGPLPAINQFFNPSQQAGSQLASTTALATIEALSDAIDDQTFPGVAFGIAAAYISSNSYLAAGTGGRIGCKIAGGATEWQNHAEAAVFRWNGRLYRPTGLILPKTIEPFSVLKEKSNDTNSSQVNALSGVVEYIGVWGLEDYPDSLDWSNNIYLHNARYSNTYWGTILGGPTAPCYAIGGTYTGNATYQTISLPAPAHFVWIRALTGGSLGVKFFGAGLGAHTDGREQFRPSDMVRIWTDLLGNAQFTVSGNNAEINANGVIYQYIVFCDPGMRFCHCGAYNFPPALAAGVLPLFVTDFLPEAGFIQKDIIGSSITTVNMSYKGVGNGVNDGQTVAGVAQANWGSFAAGVLTARANSIANMRAQFNFCLWRTTDPDCGDIAVQITSYVGDGNASKVISLPLTTGRYPLLAVVIPHGTIGYMRDPSHTGSNSCSIQSLANSTTAITSGGIDQISVGLTLNTLGTTYEVFCIMGDSAGWNNGIFYVPDCKPKGPWTPPTYDPPTEPVFTMEGGMNFNGDAAMLVVKDWSGIYTLIPNKLTDTLIDRQAGQPSIEVAIPDPKFKTGYIGG